MRIIVEKNTCIVLGLVYFMNARWLLALTPQGRKEAIMETKRAKEILWQATLTNLRGWGPGWLAKIKIGKKTIAKVKDYGTGGMVFITPEQGCSDQVKALEAAAQVLAVSPLLQSGGSMEASTLGYACSYTESNSRLIAGVIAMNADLK